MSNKAKGPSRQVQEVVKRASEQYDRMDAMLKRQKSIIDRLMARDQLMQRALEEISRGASDADTLASKVLVTVQRIAEAEEVPRT